MYQFHPHIEAIESADRRPSSLRWRRDEDPPAAPAKLPRRRDVVAARPVKAHRVQQGMIGPRLLEKEQPRFAPADEPRRRTIQRRRRDCPYLEAIARQNSHRPPAASE